MRVSNEFCLKGPAPVVTRLLLPPPDVAFGKKARIAVACGEILVFGIRLPAKGVRPVPVALFPVAGSKIWPFTAPKAAKYSLRSQLPGLPEPQVLSTKAVGIVYRLVMPCCCLVP